MSDDIIPLRHSYALSMVERISDLTAEVERLRAAILEWDASTDCFWDDVDSHDAAVQRYRAARAAAVKEARRG